MLFDLVTTPLSTAFNVIISVTRFSAPFMFVLQVFIMFDGGTFVNSVRLTEIRATMTNGPS